MSIAITAPGWIEEQRRHLANVTARPPVEIARIDRAAESLSATIDQLHVALLGDHRETYLRLAWELVCDSIQRFVDLQTATRPNFLSFRGSSQGQVGERVTTALLARMADLARTVLVNRPELGLALPASLEQVVWTIHVSPGAYLRAMWNLFWSAIRHPFSETTIDLSTGRVLYRT